MGLQILDRLPARRREAGWMWLGSLGDKWTAFGFSERGDGFGKSLSDDDLVGMAVPARGCWNGRAGHHSTGAN